MVITISKASEFAGVSEKNLQRFEIKTPLKHDVRGWIVKKRGSKMGSLLIDYFDGKETLQFIQGMPKLHYYDSGEVRGNIRLFDKADGTNIVFCPLIKDGEVVEVTTKTRLMPITKKSWSDLAKRSEIYDKYVQACKETKFSLATEMYGFINPHAVDYSSINLSFRLDFLTVLDMGKALLTTEADKISKKFGLNRIEEFARVEKGKYLITPEYKKKYGKFIIPLEIYEPHKFNKLNEYLENYFEDMNKNYMEITKRAGIITEGVVSHVDIPQKGESFMLKVKASSVKERHIKASGGIPKVLVAKALEKADENLDSIEDKEVVIKFIYEELGEEYPIEAVERSEVRIENMYNNFLANKLIAENLQSVIDDLNEVGGDVSDKMKYFSEKYPELKPKSSLIYQLITKQR